MAHAQISQQTRSKSLELVTQGNYVDVLVVGGGITGAGIALDAASRGLSTVLIEAQDWAQGTSSRSSKLVHGGMRYLYNLDFKLVNEALRERGLLIKSLAPHLVKAQPFLWPLKIPFIERAYSSCGVGLYDLMATCSNPGIVPLQKHYSKKGTLEIFPDVRTEKLAGSIRFYDARVDDGRIVVNIVRTAAQYGAHCISRCEVISYIKQEGIVVGAHVIDHQTNTRHDIYAHHVINATGIWTEQTQALADTTGGLKVLVSKGTHIVVPRNRIKGDAGLFIRTEKSVLFIIPWKRVWVIGTTDTPYNDNYRNPVASREDVLYLLDHANAVINSNLTEDDVISTWAGLRPLLQPGTADGDKTKSTKVSREHTVTQAAPGLSVIAGGKLTTYRVMAQDAVNFALGKQRAQELPSCTQNIPLSGALRYHEMWEKRYELAQRHNISVEHIEDMLNRYGSDIELIFDLIKQDHQLVEELASYPVYLKAEIVFAVTHEGALHLEDILTIRTRMSIEMKDRGISAAQEVAQLVAPYLEWDDETLAREVQLYCMQAQTDIDARSINSEKDAQACKARVENITPMNTL